MSTTTSADKVDITKEDLEKARLCVDLAYCLLDKRNQYQLDNERNTANHRFVGHLFDTAMALTRVPAQSD